MATTFWGRAKGFLAELKARPVTLGAYGAACFFLGAFLL